jgi:hypothetical protein
MNMVTYGDYFSRKMLHQCGVSPTETLFHKEENANTGTQRIENIRLKMSEIYQTLYRGYTEKKAAAKESFDNFRIESKIVSAFYDSGILSNAERDYFQRQTQRTSPEREQICVEEANALTDVSKAQKVEEPAKMPLKRDVLK